MFIRIFTFSKTINTNVLSSYVHLLAGARKLFMTLYACTAEHSIAPRWCLAFPNNFSKMNQNAVFPHVHNDNRTVCVAKRLILNIAWFIIYIIHYWILQYRKWWIKCNWCVCKNIYIFISSLAAAHHFDDVCMAGEAISVILPARLPFRQKSDHAVQLTYPIYHTRKYN